MCTGSNCTGTGSTSNRIGRARMTATPCKHQTASGRPKSRMESDRPGWNRSHNDSKQIRDIPSA
eukprot:557373-Pyramimonas_sp.AAC.1